MEEGDISSSSHREGPLAGRNGYHMTNPTDHQRSIRRCMRSVDVTITSGVNTVPTFGLTSTARTTQSTYVPSGRLATIRCWVGEVVRDDLSQTGQGFTNLVPRLSSPATEIIDDQTTNERLDASFDASMHELGTRTFAIGQGLNTIQGPDPGIHVRVSFHIRGADSIGGNERHLFERFEGFKEELERFLAPEPLPATLSRPDNFDRLLGEATQLIRKLSFSGNGTRTTSFDGPQEAHSQTAFQSRNIIGRLEVLSGDLQRYFLLERSSAILTPSRRSISLPESASRLVRGEREERRRISVDGTEAAHRASGMVHSGPPTYNALFPPNVLFESNLDGEIQNESEEQVEGEGGEGGEQDEDISYYGEVVQPNAGPPPYTSIYESPPPYCFPGIAYRG